MTQKKTDLEKLKGLKINSTVRRGPPGSRQTAPSGKRGAGGSKLLGALLGKAPAVDTADGAASTDADKPKQD